MPGWSVEAAYFFHQSACGQGYGVVAVSMSVAVHVPSLNEGSPLAHPANAASRRLLQKAGIKTAQFAPEMNRALYRRRRQKLPAVAQAPTRAEAVGATRRDPS